MKSFEPKTSILLFLSLFFLLCLSQQSVAQDENLQYKDHVYVDNIHSVQFYSGNLPLSDPVINLNSGTLFLSFDDLDADVKDYVYTVVHCNADWTPSELTELDYIDGFSEEEIEDYEFSYSTLVPYTNYTLRLPNEDMKFMLAGNYLLKIYDAEDDKILVATRRFFVVDPIMIVSSRLTPPAKVGQFKTHHEIDFEIIHKDIRIKNPQAEVKVIVRQNSRWDNAITDLKPLFVRNERLVYDHQGKVCFPALKEFRSLDLRTFRYRLEKVSEILELDDKYDVTLFKDEARSYKEALTREDINGKFVVESIEDRDANVRGDYAEVFFSLARNLDEEGADVYVVGGFSNWELREDCKMVYNRMINAYVTKLFLKQGFYDYMYAVVPHGSKKFDLEEFEGNWHETENEYSILVYFRPFGQRYDKLVSYHINSRK